MQLWPRTIGVARLFLQGQEEVPQVSEVDVHCYGGDSKGRAYNHPHTANNRGGNLNVCHEMRGNESSVRRLRQGRADQGNSFCALTLIVSSTTDALMKSYSDKIRMKDMPKV